MPLWAAILLIVLLPGIIFAPPLLSGKTIGPFDQMASMIPGREVSNELRSWDILQADGALQFYGWRDLVFEAHRNGKQPFWNPYQLAGTPLLANSQSAGYYPLHILIGKLGIPTGTAIVFLAWLHLSVAGLGLFALARRLGAGIEGATLGAVGLALSPFAISWSALASVMTTCAWIPVLLAAQLALIQRPSWRTALAVTGSAVMLLTGGHLQFVFYGLFAWLIFTPIAFFTQSEKPKPIVSALASFLAIGIAGFAALPQINPALEFSKQSHRQSVASTEGYKAYQSSAIKPFEFLGFLAPGFMGTPGIPDNPGTEENIPSTWNMYAKPGGNYAESAIWLGVPIVMGICMLRRRQNWRELSPVIAVALAGLLLALGTPLAQLLYFGIPGFSATGSPGRAAIIFVLAACTLAAVAIPKTPSDSNPTEKAYAYFGLLGVAILTILASTRLGGIESWVGLDLNPIIARRTTDTLPLLVASLVCAAGAWFAWAKLGWHVLGLAAALIAHLVVAQTQILPFSNPPKPQLPDTPNQRVAFVNQKWDFFAPPESGIMPPNFATTARIMDIGGYDSLMALSTVELLKSINAGQDAAPPTNGNMMFVKPSLDPAALSEAGVTRVYSKLGVDNLTQTDQIGDIRVYDLAGPGLVTPSTVQIKNITTEGFEISGAANQEIVVRFRNILGWSVNGIPNSIEESPWITASAKSDSTIFKYTPPGYLPWPWLPSILALLALISVAIPNKSLEFPVDSVEENEPEEV